MAKKIVLDGDIDEVVRILETYIQSGNVSFLIGSGASLPAIPIAGDIEMEINDLLEADNEAEADLRALAFIEEIEDKQVRAAIGIEEEESSETKINYLTFLTAVDRILFERKNILLPRQANIFTTNYDCFIEQAADEHPSLILNDGFDRSSALNTNFSFAPERYFDRTYRSGSVYTRQAEMPTINLIKMHGSLSWKKMQSRITFQTNYPDALSDEQRDDEAQVLDALRQRALILPNLRKFESTLMDRVYYDLLRMFSNAMDRDNALLISFGFSFADEHILDLTKRALRNPTSQLFVCAYSAAGATEFEAKFANHRNVKILAPTDDVNIDFPLFNSILSQIVPADPNQHG